MSAKHHPATTAEQPEYIITEEQVKTIGEITNNRRIVDILRSRPAVKTPATLTTLEDVHSEILRQLPKDNWYLIRITHAGGKSRLLIEDIGYPDDQPPAALTDDVMDAICKNCGAKEYGACVSTDCPVVGAYKSQQQHPNGKQDGEQG